MHGPPPPPDVAIAIDEQLGLLLDAALAEAAAARSAAEIEEITASILLPFDDPDMPEEHVALLPAALERRGDVAAARLLVAATVLARPVLRRSAAFAVDRLRARGVVATGVRSVGTLAVEEARLVVDGPAEGLLVMLRRPGQRRAQLALVGIEDDGRGGVIVAAELCPPGREGQVRRALRGPDLLSPAEPLATGELLERLRAATVNTARNGVAVPLSAPFCLATLSRALTGDAAAFPHLEVEASHPLDVDPANDEEGFQLLVDRLVHDFGEHVSSRHGTECALWDHGEFASCALLEWKGRHTDGGLGHWTVEDLHAFLLEYVPRKLTLDREAVSMLPACVAELMRFLDIAGALHGDRLEELLAACQALTTPLEEANADPQNWGLAKTMATQMLAEGIDPTDEDALATWITSFNARAREERDSVIGEARPELRLHARAARPPQAPHAPAGAKRAPKARRRAARVARKANRR